MHAPGGSGIEELRHGDAEFHARIETLVEGWSDD
jgi:hypothetical protein